MQKFDYSKLIARIKEKGLNNQQVANLVGISEGQFCHKLKSEYSFKQGEMVKIIEILNIPPEEINDYFFTI